MENLNTSLNKYESCYYILQKQSWIIIIIFNFKLYIITKYIYPTVNYTELYFNQSYLLYSCHVYKIALSVHFLIIGLAIRQSLVIFYYGTRS
jgi:hypothetical protein